MTDEHERRIRELEAELAAARRVVDTLIQRAERPSRSVDASDGFAVLRALANLEAVVDEQSKELVASERRFRALFDGSPDLVVTVDDLGVVTAANRTCLDALACGPDAVVGCSLSTLFSAPDADEVERWAPERYTGVVDREVRMDNRRLVSVTAAPVLDGGGETLVVMRDVTARRKLEGELSQSRRLAAVGHLAAGVAHEINNPLAVIQLRLEFLQQLDLIPQALTQVEVVADHVARIAAIVRNLQAFARSESRSGKVVAVRELLVEALHDAGTTWEEAHARITAPSDLHVAGDPDRLVQVVVHLLGYARDAAGPEGSVTVGAHALGDQARIEVRHDGPGIPPDLLDGELFTPFVPGRGALGATLGLAIAWAIVQEHQGAIAAENLDGGGARIVVDLPRAAAAPSDVGPVARAGRPLRILCVDDESALLDVVEEFASSAGYRVTAVGSAEEALAMLDVDPGFDAILTDHRLPGLPGGDLVELLVRRHPELARRTAIMSGSFPLLTTDARTLQKPFTRRELLQLLDELAGE